MHGALAIHGGVAVTMAPLFRRAEAAVPAPQKKHANRRRFSVIHFVA
jgi:hypothetical protein